ncbi:hypothetical protein F3Y22_tig00110264pilonHSYRG00156 [Hibiscus syriacus]|uniref:DUF4283 domain-containing protein n=1 Tax=Hibiscus syriacus TaxID=106335 RepID=A0A6A3BA45_HIBSY|nr:hypothetical protein F3Y22_tig00110264pilonHSYRG00156 [Hibiscus syriacus]
MADDLMDEWQNLSLIEAEDAILDVPTCSVPELESTQWMVVCLLSPRPVNQDAMITTLSNVWKLTKSTHIVPLDDNHCVIKFRSARERESVVDGAPWSFDKHLVLFASFDSNLFPGDYRFEVVSLWVRVYGVPLNCCNRAFAESIGERLETLMAVDDAFLGIGWGQYLRIRIDLVVFRPLLGLSNRTTWGDWLRASPMKRTLAKSCHTWKRSQVVLSPSPIPSMPHQPGKHTEGKVSSSSVMGEASLTTFLKRKAIVPTTNNSGVHKFKSQRRLAIRLHLLIRR